MRRLGSCEASPSRSWERGGGYAVAARSEAPLYPSPSYAILPPIKGRREESGQAPITPTQIMPRRVGRIYREQRMLPPPYSAIRTASPTFAAAICAGVNGNRTHCLREYIRV